MEYFRVLVIGERGVGKTSLIQRFLSDTFTEKYYETNEIQYVKYLLPGLSQIIEEGDNIIPALKVVAEFWEE
ncbi:MAG: hypothetical protein GPJ54_00240 [Candidatus Heimdallarchaeota archaeon]|nr:hypothetical protein [Candidatus Heimdallarchaeota archaeon]